MADEPRRSVRATKGQHTKKDDELNTPEPPKKRASKKNIKKQEEEVEIIRCVCGATETQPDDEEPWIACDNCEAWQHNVCMGISTFDEDVPEHYLCERCSPQSHQELVESLKKGTKIWEDRRRTYEESQQKKPKRGKKGKGKRTSDLKSEGSGVTNGKDKSPSVPPSDKKKEKDAAPRANAKRKNRDDSHETEPAKDRKKSKVLNVPAPPPPPQQQQAVPPKQSPSSGLPVKIGDIDSARQGSAKLILKSLLAHVPQAVKTGKYKLSTGDTAESKAERLAIEIEDAIQKAHPSQSTYGAQARSVVANLKSNAELVTSLLARTLSPSDLAVMSTDDMASKELQQERAEMKRRSDKQAILHPEEGPRFRHTHKGIEHIQQDEQDGYAVPSDTTTAISRRRSELDPNADMATRSRENSPGDQPELPESIDDYPSQDNIRGTVTPKGGLPLTVNTQQPKQQVRKQSSSQGFDINNIFSNVQQSPVGAQHVRHPSLTGNAPPVNGPGVDPDIDKLLEDDANESPPYSPAEYNSDPDVVWRGTLTMDTVATLYGTAKHVGGSDLASSPFDWSDILSRDLRVGGRIPIEKANEYLCSLRYAPQADLVVVSVVPADETAAIEYQKLIDYFHEKNRYGVLTVRGLGNVRDTYLIPVQPSPASLPDFMENLEGHKLSTSRTEPVILIAIVIRNDPPNQESRDFDSSIDAKSPSLMSHPQRQMSLGGAGPSMSPIAPQGAFQSPGQHPLPQPSLSPEEAQRRQQQHEDRRRAQAEGEATAARILKEYINVPTVHFLMPQAYQMRPLEWEVILDILQKDPKAQQDLQHLSALLEQRGPTQQNQQ